ncbi:MAG: Demethylrebeccamycin-D-glucose O-methyltransferase [candidate division BRC1 bacterium ADurb.BinA364]|nr:MAG: Demethylrebeccamycin-D-glucose O-methyltransferase [candidate division BRC1 bacterium ADurb.BinA364]
MPIDKRQARALRKGFAEWSGTFDEDTFGPMRWTAPRTLADRLKPQLRDGDRMLDLGCGTGQSPALYAPLRLRWSGADISAAMLALAARNGAYESLRRMNIDRRRYPFAARSFDAVVSSGVFEFTAHLGQALREIARILRPGGHLAMTAEAPSRDELDFEVFESDEYYYIRYRYSRRLVETLLREAGFEPLECEKFPAYRNEYGRDIFYFAFLARRMDSRETCI